MYTQLRNMSASSFWEMGYTPASRWGEVGVCALVMHKLCKCPLFCKYLSCRSDGSNPVSACQTRGLCVL